MQRDTLSALDICLPVYGASIVRTNARKLWNTLKLEVRWLVSLSWHFLIKLCFTLHQIFQPTDSETETKALKTTQILIQVIYAEGADGGLTDSQEIEGLAKEACDECLRILKEPEKSQAKPATKVLCAFMSTTRMYLDIQAISMFGIANLCTLSIASVAKFTLKQAVPHFVKLFLDPDEAPNRPPTLRLLSDVVAAARDSVLGDSGVSTAEGDAPLSPYKDEVLGVFTVGLQNAATCKHALEGLKNLVTTKGLLSDEELGFIVHNVNEILLKEGMEDDDIG